MVAVSNLSGLAGIAYWVNTYYRLPDDMKVNKRDEFIVKMKEWIDEQYDEGRQTVIGDEELEELLDVYAPDFVQKLKQMGKR